MTQLCAIASALLHAGLTSISDIGRSFNGEPLTDAEYLRIESAYIATVLEFLRESGVSSLEICGLENHRHASLMHGDVAELSLGQVAVVLPRMLREEFWCKLEGVDSFVHIGNDYYMYLGVPSACPVAEQLAARLGLFVESFQSPYRPGCGRA